MGLDMMMQFHRADALDQLKLLETASVDMIYLDPPFGISTGKAAIKRPNSESEFGGIQQAAWDQIDDWIAWWAPFEKEVKRIAKPKAAFVLCGTYHNLFKAAYYMQTQGYWIINKIVWEKSNPVPNFLGSRLKAAHEDMLFMVKNEKTKGYTFNHHAMKFFNDGKQMPDVWHLPVCAGKERLKDADGKTLHPTQKPLKLLKMLITMLTNEGDTILDPFAGTGTTALAARMLGRHSINIERDPVYYRAAIDRLDAYRETSVA